MCDNRQKNRKLNFRKCNFNLSRFDVETVVPSFDRCKIELVIENEKMICFYCSSIKISRWSNEEKKKAKKDKMDAC